MNVRPLFNNNDAPTLETYLEKFGVNLEEYKNPIHAVENYEHYDNIHNGVAMLRKAIMQCANDINKQIVIVCDSDCDGYCSTTLAVQFLLSERLAHNNIKVLFHTKKQHGLSADIMAQLNDLDLNNVVFMWLPDAGTNDADQCMYLTMKGVSILITDHHEQSVANDFATIINNQTSRNVENKNLCGAGVTHKLVTAYCNRYGSDFHQHCIDIVALATISDVMDMRSLENRMIVKWGIKHMNNNFLRGLCAIMIQDGIITPTSLAWNVVPKINAVCRSDNQKLKKRMFFAFVSGKDYSQIQGLFNETKMKSVVGDMIKMHETQRNNANKLYESAIQNGFKGDKVKIFSTEDTPYTGLVAMKLSSHYNCPCMVVHDSGNNLMGSLRSPCDMRTKLRDSGLMKICEGHEASCGVGWHKKNTNDLIAYCNNLDLTPNPKDVIISTDNVFIDNNVFNIAQQGAEYWGTGIPEPLIHFKDILINGQDIKTLGRNKTTIKFLYGDIEFIAFFVSKDKREALHVGEDIDMRLEILGTPSINTFKGKDTKQVVVKEWEIA